MLFRHVTKSVAPKGRSYKKRADVSLPMEAPSRFGAR
jgi:hypothetical protein